jgi:hypothetical protein
MNMNISELQRRFPAPSERSPFGKIGFPVSKYVDLRAVWESFGGQGAAASVTASPSRRTGQVDTARLRRSAAHEAGHCVQLILEGGHCTGLTLRDDGSGFCGGSGSLPSNAAWARYSAAGAAGERLHCMVMAQAFRIPQPRDQWGEGHDRQDHARETGLTGLAHDQRWAQDVSECVDGLRPHWSFLQALAHALFDYRELSADDVLAIKRDYMWV